MSHAEVVAIYVAPERGAPTVEVDMIDVVAAQGVVGDRKFIDAPDEDKPSRRQLTLIEAEEIEAFNDSFDAGMAAGDFRRQVVTRGIRLNDFVNREFAVGNVRLRGTMLCEPCKYLAQKTHRQLLWGLKGRGGLCAEVLEGGKVSTGDAISIERD
ncbi:MAG: MOSC domain-containing protein [Pirellulales bacterium]|nr:MOSC domain-containing protein [Pirellulales bacterium]